MLCRLQKDSSVYILQQQRKKSEVNNYPALGSVVKKKRVSFLKEAQYAYSYSLYFSHAGLAHCLGRQPYYWLINTAFDDWLLHGNLEGVWMAVTEASQGRGFFFPTRTYSISSPPTHHLPVHLSVGLSGKKAPFLFHWKVSEQQKVSSEFQCTCNQRHINWFCIHKASSSKVREKAPRPGH